MAGKASLARQVQRPQAPEIEVRLNIERRISQLQRDHHAHQEARHAPKHRGNHAPADDIIIIARERHRRLIARHHMAIIGRDQREIQPDRASRSHCARLNRKSGILRSSHRQQTGQ
jgi:hypothetical protein